MCRSPLVRITTYKGRFCGCISQQAQKQHTRLTSRRHTVSCHALDDKQGGQGSNVSRQVADIAGKFNPVYLAITGVFALLLLFRNPYIYAVLTVATILPQNSNVTSLNNLVLLFYESGLFMNFAEAVYCVRLVTWLSMGFMVGSFAVFS
eukprot:jgi/Chrzof1/3859/Cz13g11130.t1